MILGIAMAFFLYTILVVRNFFKFQAVGIEKKKCLLVRAHLPKTATKEIPGIIQGIIVHLP